MSDFEVLDNLFEPVVVVNSDGSIVYTSNRFVTFIKKPPRIVRVAATLSELIPENQFNIQELIGDSVKSGAMVNSEEIKITLDDGTNYTLVIKVVPYLEQYLVCFNDVSVEKVLYEKYKEQMEELKVTHGQIIQADKLRTLGELTAGISHEINNPLTVAAGNAEILGFSLESEDLNVERENIQESLNNIVEGHNRIQNIIVNMKDFLHKSEEKKEYVRLSDVIDKSMELVRPSFEEGQVKLNLKIEKADIVSLINKLKIEQVVVNLLQNALDSILESKRTDGEVTIIVGQKEKENLVYIDVIDNGVGISEENKAKIFETFFTTKSVGKGTGLGLSISHRIIQSHQGDLKILDHEGGAHLRIELPSLEVISFADSENILLTSPDAEGVRVLVVDNEPHILNLCHKFLESSKFIFIGSTNGVDALNILDKINVDLILTDFNMPEMGGREFIKALRAKGKTTPVFYMTTKDHVEDFQEDKEKLSIKGMVIKPFTQDELIKSLEGAVVNNES